MGNGQGGGFHTAELKRWAISALLFPPAVFAAVLIFADSANSRPYTFAGGPAGGTYTHYAKAVAALSSKTDLRIRAIESRGSIENVKKVHTGMANFGIAYSGDIYKARNGRLKKNVRRYRHIMAVAYFYGAAAQLVVKSDAGIDSAKKLVSRRVGVGNPGSGAAGNCELFFRELGIWDQVYKRFLGYKKASMAFRAGELDAFWLFTGFPNSSVVGAAESGSISLVNVYNDAESIGLFKTHPYFSRIVIPGGTYKGVADHTATIQDSAVWIANSRVPAEDVYKILSEVFSAEGLALMARSHRSAKSMSVKDGIHGIVTPLHPGAEKFWREKGLSIPAGLVLNK